MGNEQMESAIRKLQETTILLSHIEKRQTEKLQLQSEKFRIRTEESLAEIADKLNGLIGYVAGQKPGDPRA
jgi:hypothetical protein